MKIDLTALLQAVIMVLSAIITSKVVPWIKSKTSTEQFSQLETAAKVAVYAAEQVYQSGHGNEKLHYALGKLMQAGYSVDEDTLKTVIEKSVYEMNKSPNMKELMNITASSIKPEKAQTDAKAENE